MQDCKVAAGCWRRRAGDCMVEETKEKEKETSVRIRNERGMLGGWPRAAPSQLT